MLSIWEYFGRFPRIKDLEFLILLFFNIKKNLQIKIHF